jgi:hypothetical protein
MGRIQEDSCLNMCCSVHRIRNLCYETNVKYKQNRITINIFITGQYTPDQHTKNINKGLYMQPKIRTDCTTDYNVEQIFIAKQL